MEKLIRFCELHKLSISINKNKIIVSNCCTSYQSDNPDEILESLKSIYE
jgi:hypothetical protein